MTVTETSRYPAAGEVIDGKYRIERMLGEGGMGAVAAATHLLLRAPVALKFISPDVIRLPGVVDRFMNEGAVAMKIDSENVVRILDIGRLSNGLPFLVMEYMDGCDLGDLLEREAAETGFAIPRAIHFVLQILRALQAAHAAGVVHRDLKPSNCFVIARDDEPEFVKLLDFGISKNVGDGNTNQKLTQTNTGLGTPLYMSPEQARNARDANARSDLYSVAAILYELLTGRTPYDADSPNDLLFKLFTSEPDPIQSVRADVPDELAKVIHRGLSKNPDDRPANALEFADLLVPFADDRSTALVARMRATTTARLSALPGEGRPTVAPASKKGVAFDSMAATALAPALDGTQLAINPGTAAGKTNLDMGMSNPGESPAPKKTPMALIAVGIAGLAVVGTVAAMKFSGGTTTTPQPVRESLVTSVATSATAATSSPPATTAEASANVAPSASAAPAVSASATASSKGNVKPPSTGGRKNDPFGAGLVQ
ncbi:MAG: serine/threonine-protein kinase [Polyangiaceae bacterium]